MLYRESVPKHTLELLEKLSHQASEMGFYLAGGTALALRFGHRVSVDLDFFKSGAFQVEEIIKFVEGVANEVIIVNKGEFSVSILADDTKVEFLRYDYSMIENLESFGGITLCPLLDNALMKLSAVTGRGARKDFADIAAILKTISLQELLIQFQNKFPNTDVFTVIKSLTWFEDAEEDPDPVMLIESDWGKIKQTIEDEVNAL